jgi:hypothetical protein
MTNKVILNFYLALLIRDFHFPDFCSPVTKIGNCDTFILAEFFSGFPGFLPFGYQGFPMIKFTLCHAFLLVDQHGKDLKNLSGPVILTVT